MRVEGEDFRTIWEKDKSTIQIIDQRLLPFEFKIADLTHPEQACRAISEMWVRGAGLIGATAGYAMYLASIEASKDLHPKNKLNQWKEAILATRPTAVNLKTAVDRQMSQLVKESDPKKWPENSLLVAREIAEEDVESCKSIGQHGYLLIHDIAQRKKRSINILTHCNAGWLAFVDFGSALSPIYKAFDEKLDIHVWVDETRPRNQGARLTAWELEKHGVPCTLIPDNTGGHLMQHGMVDMVIVGADRISRNGDAANKIGTYLKALAAIDNHVPFYVAFPSSTIDWNCDDGVKGIPIEQRSSKEVLFMEGLLDGKPEEVLISTQNTKAANYGFDVTPSRLITGLITERGVCKPQEDALLELFPEMKKNFAHVK